MNGPPICENCKRVVDRTLKLALVLEGRIMLERRLCSACRVHVTDAFEQSAPWIQSVPVRR